MLPGSKHDDLHADQGNRPTVEREAAADGPRGETGGKAGREEVVRRRSGYPLFLRPVELLFLRRALQRRGRDVAADHGGLDEVEVAGPDEALVLDGAEAGRPLQLELVLL